MINALGVDEDAVEELLDALELAARAEFDRTYARVNRDFARGMRAVAIGYTRENFSLASVGSAVLSRTQAGAAIARLRESYTEIENYARFVADYARDDAQNTIDLFRATAYADGV